MITSSKSKFKKNRWLPGDGGSSFSDGGSGGGGSVGELVAQQRSKRELRLKKGNERWKLISIEEGEQKLIERFAVVAEQCFLGGAGRR